MVSLWKCFLPRKPLNTCMPLWKRPQKATKTGLSQLEPGSLSALVSIIILAKKMRNSQTWKAISLRMITSSRTRTYCSVSSFTYLRE